MNECNCLVLALALFLTSLAPRGFGQHSAYVLNYERTHLKPYYSSPHLGGGSGDGTFVFDAFGRSYRVEETTLDASLVFEGKVFALTEGRANATIFPPRSDLSPGDEAKLGRTRNPAAVREDGGVGEEAGRILGAMPGRDPSKLWARVTLGAKVLYIEPSGAADWGPAIPPDASGSIVYQEEDVSPGALPLDDGLRMNETSFDNDHDSRLRLACRGLKAMGAGPEEKAKASVLIRWTREVLRQDTEVGLNGDPYPPLDLPIDQAGIPVCLGQLYRVGTWCEAASSKGIMLSDNLPAAVLIHLLSRALALGILGAPGTAHLTASSVMSNGSHDGVSSRALGLAPSLAQKISSALQELRANCSAKFGRVQRLAADDPYCGNGVVERGEECDCGAVATCDQVDPCCVPRGSWSGRPPCMLREGAHCSARAGMPCCNPATCRLYPAFGTTCRNVSECKMESRCDGFSPRCPALVPRREGLPCKFNYRVCRQGACNGSPCSLIGLDECICVEASEGCHVCCLSTTGMCSPAYKFGLVTPDDKFYQRLMGTSCNGAHGWCNGQGRCVNKLSLPNKDGNNKGWWQMSWKYFMTGALLAVFLGMMAMMVLLINSGSMDEKEEIARGPGADQDAPPATAKLTSGSELAGQPVPPDKMEPGPLEASSSYSIVLPKTQGAPAADSPEETTAETSPHPKGETLVSIPIPQ